MSHLDPATATAAQDVGAMLASWTNAWEDWMADVTVPAQQRSKYLGRSSKLHWVRAPTGNNRTSPVKGIHVPADLPRAARALVCVTQVVEKLLSDRSSAIGLQSLRIWLLSQA